MSASAGWYDDPRDPTLLRYWDGVLWTENTTPKQSPTLSQSHIGEAYPVPAAQPQAQPTQPGGGQYGGGQQGGGQQPYPPYQQPGQQGHPTQQGQWPGQQPGQGQGQPPWQGQAGGGYSPAPQWQQARPIGVVTTPDGTPTAGWWKRVGARFLDGIFASIIALPLTGWFYLQYIRIIRTWFRQVMDDAAAGRSSSTMTLPPQAYSYLIPAALIALAVATIYEVAFLTRTGATPGKRILGISVRLRERPGPPPALAVLKRYAVWQGATLFSLIPVLGSLLSLFPLIDGLWPLWDQRRQALHDKVAATNVVLGPQPRRAKGETQATSGASGRQDRPADQGGSGLA